jgi:hypothetical protein
MADLPRKLPNGPPAQSMPPEAEISPDGVDLSLIRWMLELTPLERLEVLQDFVDGSAALRHGRAADQ